MRWHNDARGLAALYLLCATVFVLALLVPIAYGPPSPASTPFSPPVQRSVVRVWGASGETALATARLVPFTPATLLVPRSFDAAGSGPERARIFDATPFFAPTADWSALSVRAANGTLLRLYGCVPSGLRAAVAAAALRNATAAAPLLVLVPSGPCGANAVPTFATLSSWLPDVVAGGAIGAIVEAPPGTPAPDAAPLFMAAATYTLAHATLPALAALPSADFVALASAAAADATLCATLSLANASAQVVRTAREYAAYACLGGETLAVVCAVTLPLAACVLRELALVVRVARGRRAPRATLVPLYAAYAGLVLFTLALAAQQLASALGGDVYTLGYANDVLGEAAWLGLYGAYASVAMLFVRMLVLARDPAAGAGFGTSSLELYALYMAWLAFLLVAGAAVVAVSVAAPSNSFATATALHVVALVPTAAATLGVGVAFVVRARRASGAAPLLAALRRLTALLVGAALCFAALAALYVAQSVVRARADTLAFGSTLPCALRLAIKLVALAGAAVLLVFLHAWRRSLYKRSSAATTADAPSTGARERHAARRAHAPALMASAEASAFSTTEGEARDFNSKTMEMELPE